MLLLKQQSLSLTSFEVPWKDFNIHTDLNGLFIIELFIYRYYYLFIVYFIVNIIIRSVLGLTVVMQISFPTFILWYKSCNYICNQKTYSILNNYRRYTSLSYRRCILSLFVYSPWKYSNKQKVNGTSIKLIYDYSQNAIKYVVRLFLRLWRRLNGVVKGNRKINTSKGKQAVVYLCREAKPLHHKVHVPKIKDIIKVCCLNTSTDATPRFQPSGINNSTKTTIFGTILRYISLSLVIDYPLRGILVWFSNQIK